MRALTWSSTPDSFRALFRSFFSFFRLGAWGGPVEALFRACVDIVSLANTPNVLFAAPTFDFKLVRQQLGLHALLSV
jgi:hypothetical protein